MATRATSKPAAATKSPARSHHAPKDAAPVAEAPVPAKPAPPAPAEDLISPKKKKPLHITSITPISRIGSKAAPVAPEPEEVAAPAPKPKAEAVSLIDEKPSKGDSEIKKARTSLPPISRITASPLARLEVPTPAPAPTPAAEPHAELEVSETGEKIIHIKPPIIVRDLAAQLGLKPFQMIQDLMGMGIFANINMTIEPEVATKVCEKHGFVFEVEKRKKDGGVHKTVEVVHAPVAPEVIKSDELSTRPPIVTFMGHVDHGKTSLMDAIRKTRVAKGEAGGITQHIGAYSVDYKGQHITFLDTPGHAAFTAMRARGASVTDIVVLVVAADDGLMPQTLEAINHAKAAKVQIIVAINKIDLPSANVDRVKGQLQEKGLTPEDWGGETICCAVSATKGTGIDSLLESMLLVAEIQELKANADSPARGTVIEAQIEAGRGPTATIIVQVGTLKPGDPFICGNFSGKVKALISDTGAMLKSAGPSTPVRILGFAGLPNSGDEFLVMESEKSAKTLGEERQAVVRQEKLSTPQRATLENLFDSLADGQRKVLQIILKCDVQGSHEAVVTSLEEIQSKKIDLRIIHSAVGPITESDMLLATASNAVVIGFNVKVEAGAANTARREGIQVKLFSIIYELIDQIKEAMAGMLDPELRETIVGHAEIKQIFNLTRGVVAGSIVIDGRMQRTGRARVLRKKQPIYDGGIATLKRFTDDVKEVRNGLECGIKLGDFNEYEVGDIVECYTLEKIPQKL